MVFEVNSIIKVKNYLSIIGVNHFSLKSKESIKKLLNNNSKCNINQFNTIFLEITNLTAKEIMDNKIEQSEVYSLLTDNDYISDINNTEMTDFKSSSVYKRKNCLKFIDIPYYKELNYYIWLKNNSHISSDYNNEYSKLSNNKDFKDYLYKRVLKDMRNDENSSTSNSSAIDVPNTNSVIDLLVNINDLKEFYLSTHSLLRSEVIGRYIDNLNLSDDEIQRYSECYDSDKERLFSYYKNREKDMDEYFKMINDCFIINREQYMIDVIIKSLIKDQILNRTKEGSQIFNSSEVNANTNSINTNINYTIITGAYHVEYIYNTLNKILI